MSYGTGGAHFIYGGHIWVYMGVIWGSYEDHIESYGGLMVSYGDHIRNTGQASKLPHPVVGRTTGLLTNVSN